MSDKGRPDTEVEMDMTPMIDVTFLLVIFFIIVNDMTQSELEELKLPVAITAVNDDPPKGRPILNVMPDGEVIIKRQSYFKPGEQPPPGTPPDPFHPGRPDFRWKLAQKLAFLAANMTKKVDEKYPQLGELPDDPILIRADRNTEFKHISKIMEVCTRPDIKIWRVQLAAAEDESKKQGG
ncbi:MAG: biopolymer transporter ExbD [Planctomycetota bacterium]|nr:MAG: biopolymer transporter ExbD [Planctomycetota bacterium]